MGFFDNAQEALDRGFAVAKGAVSGVAVEQSSLVKRFVRLCNDGWEQGWHESNGGNASCRLTGEEVAQYSSYFYDTASSWVPLGVAAPSMGGAFFLVTRAGAFMRNVALDPDASLGMVELDGAGSAWRIVWGFKNGGMPTSELAGHVLMHEARAAATGGLARVIYHAHPANTIALSAVMPLDSRTITRALWKITTESVLVFPDGIGVVPWMVPGSLELAQRSAQLMATHGACIWAQHGLCCSGVDFDETFGLMHTIEKAAGIYRHASLFKGGNEALANTIPDAGLRSVAQAYGIAINEAFLSEA